MRIAGITLGAALLLADAAFARHALCVSAGGMFEERACAVREGLTSSVAAAETTRKFAWLSRAQNHILLGILRPGETEPNLIERPLLPLGAMLPMLAGEATISLAEATLGAWTLTLEPWWLANKERLNVSVIWVRTAWWLPSVERPYSRKTSGSFGACIRSGGRSR